MRLSRTNAAERGAAGPCDPARDWLMTEAFDTKPLVQCRHSDVGRRRAAGQEVR
jgi:hypothetical protein